MSDTAPRDAGLRYADDARPGLARARRADGERVSDQTRARIEALAIPPAWTDVWICPHPRGHLQATGRDARGRKQYRYHADWSVHRNRLKFDRMVPFGEGLPALRQRVEADLKRPGLDATRWSHSPSACWTRRSSGSATPSMPTPTGPSG